MTARTPACKRSRSRSCHLLQIEKDDRYTIYDAKRLLGKAYDDPEVNALLCILVGSAAGAYQSVTDCGSEIHVSQSVSD